MSTWNPWKVTAIAMALVMTTALVTGLVVANWTGRQLDWSPEARTEASSNGARTVVRPVARGASTAPAAETAAPATRPMPPTRAAIEACNQWAAEHTGPQDKARAVVKNGAVGAIGGVVGAGGMALYGLNENHKHDERYREAYASCLRARGYAV